MKKITSFPRAVRWYAGAAFAATGVFAVLRTLNLSFFFDSAIGYYTSGALLPLFTHLLLALCLVGFAAAAWLCFRKSPAHPTADTETLPLRIAAGIPAAGFFADAIGEIMGDGSIWLGLLSLSACLYFLMLLAQSGTPALRVLTGFCAMARLLTELARTYWDVTVPMNAPDQVLFQFACVAGMLFLVCELRASVSEARSALYDCSAAVAALLLGGASIPSLLAAAQGQLSADPFPMRYCLLLTLFVYVAARLIAWMMTPVAPVRQEAAAEDREVPEVPSASEPTEPTANTSDEQAPPQA